MEPISGQNFLVGMVAPLGQQGGADEAKIKSLLCHSQS
jgi:hypothetical protein